MPERTARDIMVPIDRYVTVRACDCLKEAIKRLRRAALSYGHRTLVVLDDDKNLVGFVTTRTLLKALSVYGFDEDIETADSWGTFFTRLEKERLKNVKVKKIMRPVSTVFVNENTPLPEVAKTILSSQINHVPVLDENKKVVGIVRTIDLLDVIAGLMEPGAA